MDDCAAQTGCQFNFLSLSPEEQQELEQEYMQAMGELQWEHDDLMMKINDDIRATVERHQALLERTRNNMQTMVYDICVDIYHCNEECVSDHVETYMWDDIKYDCDCDLPISVDGQPWNPPRFMRRYLL